MWNERECLDEALKAYQSGNARDCVAWIRRCQNPSQAMQILDEMCEPFTSVCREDVYKSLGVECNGTTAPERFYVFHVGNEDRIIVEVRKGKSGSVAQKLWPASLVLAELLLAEPQRVRDLNVLELGSGTGFIGLLPLPWRTITLTDLEPSLAQRNVERQGIKNATVMQLKWGEEPHLGPVDVILMADVCYDVDVCDDLVKCLNGLLTTNSQIVYWVESVREEDVFQYFLAAFQKVFSVARLEICPPRLFQDERRCRTGIDFIDHRVECFTIGQKV